MRCLSVSQPFADLIVSGKKTIELRKWNTRFRGEFLVHAPLKVREDDAKRLGIDRGFVTGAIIGTAEIFDVKIYPDEIELKKDSRMHLASKAFQNARFGFMLKNAKAFRVSFPYKGRLGFFETELSVKESGIEPSGKDHNVYR